MAEQQIKPQLQAQPRAEPGAAPEAEPGAQPGAQPAVPQAAPVADGAAIEAVPGAAADAIDPALANPTEPHLYLACTLETESDRDHVVGAPYPLTHSEIVLHLEAPESAPVWCRDHFESTELRLLLKHRLRHAQCVFEHPPPSACTIGDVTEFLSTPDLDFDDVAATNAKLHQICLGFRYDAPWVAKLVTQIATGKQPLVTDLMLVESEGWSNLMKEVQKEPDWKSRYPVDVTNCITVKQKDPSDGMYNCARFVHVPGVGVIKAIKATLDWVPYVESTGSEKRLCIPQLESACGSYGSSMFELMYGECTAKWFNMGANKLGSGVVCPEPGQSIEPIVPAEHPYANRERRVGPLVPLAPRAPLAPLAPRAPLAPLAPRAPLEPLVPLAPRAPLAPIVPPMADAKPIVIVNLDCATVASDAADAFDRRLPSWCYAPTSKIAQDVLREQVNPKQKFCIAPTDIDGVGRPSVFTVHFVDDKGIQDAVQMLRNPVTNLLHSEDLSVKDEPSVQSFIDAFLSRKPYNVEFARGPVADDRGANIEALPCFQPTSEAAMLILSRQRNPKLKYCIVPEARSVARTEYGRSDTRFIVHYVNDVLARRAVQMFRDERGLFSDYAPEPKPTLSEFLDALLVLGKKSYKLESVVEPGACKFRAP